MDGKINGPQRSLEGGGARGRKGEKGNEGWKGREGRGERGGCCGKQGLLEGVVARQMGWQHLGYLLHLRFGVSSPHEDHGQCKASPSCTAWSQGTAVPRVSIRLVPLHAKHSPCSIDEGPKSMPWGPLCSNIAGFHRSTSQSPRWSIWYPQSEETLKVHKPLG